MNSEDLSQPSELRSIPSVTTTNTPPFPIVTHTPEGDIIEVYLSGVAFRGEPIGNGVVIHRDEDLGDVVGFTIEGVSRFLK